MNTLSLLTRRTFVHHSSTLALAGTIGHRVDSFRTSGSTEATRGTRGTRGTHVDAHVSAHAALADPSLIRSLSMRAIDAANAAGAAYADVRVTRTVRQRYDVQITSETKHAQSPYSCVDTESLWIGVRALVNGYWGFAASPYWVSDEAVRLARAAVAQAAENAKGPARPVDFGRYPSVTGSWTTPIAIDPFQISVEEKMDWMMATHMTIKQVLPVTSSVTHGVVFPALYASFMSAEFVRQEHALATTEGSYVTQTFFRTKGDAGVSLEMHPHRGDIVNAHAGGLAETGRGWELFPEAKLVEQAPGLLKQLEASVSMPRKPVEVGRFDVVCDAVTIANLVDATFGRAAEIDRALGYEANASGTSYLGPDPLTMLGTAVANDLVTVTADRSLPTGLATVKWDAEGVVPDDFPVVHAGTLVDYQTTREQAAWLAPWYQHQGKPIQSHGCANAVDASSTTLQMTPNLRLQPAASTADLESLVAGITDGIVMEKCNVQTDFQCRNGSVKVTDDLGRVYQVKQGKRVAVLADAGLLFNTTELWKNVIALGGAGSVEHVPGYETKGEPAQETVHTVRAGPAVFKNMAIFNVKKKA